MRQLHINVPVILASTVFIVMMAAVQMSLGSDGFRRFDRNHDGALTPAECPEQMRRHFSRLDRNGDGRLDSDEWAAALTLKPRQQPLPRSGDDGMSPQDAAPIWRGNDTLGDSDWLERWGLVNWNSKTGMLTGGFWGLEALAVVPDPYNPQKQVIQITYEQDEVTTESGTGMLFAPPVSLANPRKACLSYRVLFDHDFMFGRIGGKMPGLYGFDMSSGVPLNATCCAGPFEFDSSVCFSARFSFRNIRGDPQESASEMFFEVIPWMDESQCDAHPNWMCDLPYGAGMVMRTAVPDDFVPKPGRWARIDQEICLNDEGLSNGYIKVWYDGKLVVDEQDLSIVLSDGVTISGIMFHALFGQGFDFSQGSQVTQVSYIADVTISDSRLP